MFFPRLRDRHTTRSSFARVPVTCGDVSHARVLALLRRAKSVPFHVDRKARKAVRQFAAFCAGSGGRRLSVKSRPQSN
jgi:hypothetical protein